MSLALSLSNCLLVDPRPSSASLSALCICNNKPHHFIQNNLHPVVLFAYIYMNMIYESHIICFIKQLQKNPPQTYLDQQWTRRVSKSCGFMRRHGWDTVGDTLERYTPGCTGTGHSGNANTSVLPLPPLRRNHGSVITAWNILMFTRSSCSAQKESAIGFLIRSQPGDTSTPRLKAHFHTAARPETPGISSTPTKHNWCFFKLTI